MTTQSQTGPCKNKTKEREKGAKVREKTCRMVKLLLNKTDRTTKDSKQDNNTMTQQNKYTIRDYHQSTENPYNTKRITTSK